MSMNVNMKSTLDILREQLRAARHEYERLTHICQGAMHYYVPDHVFVERQVAMGICTGIGRCIEAIMKTEEALETTNPG